MGILTSTTTVTTRRSSWYSHLSSRTSLNLRRRPLRRNTVVFARGSEEDVVDKNMIVLRKRIGDIQVKEKKYCSSDRQVMLIPNSSSEWLEWERKYKETGYNSDVFVAVGLLQTFLLNTRPSVVVGLAGVLLLSLLTSTVVFSIQLVHVVNLFLQNIFD